MLPYLEITKINEEIKETVKMPNVTGITFKEAKQKLKDVGIETNLPTKEKTKKQSPRIP